MFKIFRTNLLNFDNCITLFKYFFSQQENPSRDTCSIFWRQMKRTNGVLKSNNVRQWKKTQKLNTLRKNKERKYIQISTHASLLYHRFANLFIKKSVSQSKTNYFRVKIVRVTKAQMICPNVTSFVFFQGSPYFPLPLPSPSRPPPLFAPVTQAITLCARLFLFFIHH